MTRVAPHLKFDVTREEHLEVHLIQIQMNGMLTTPRVAKKPDVRAYLTGLRTQGVQQTNQ